MKTFLISLVIAAALIVGGICFNLGIDAVADELAEECSEIAEHIDEGDFSAAADKISEVLDYVDRKKIVLASIINHENIDEIEMCISELQSYTEIEATSEAKARCNRLAHLLKHLPENYKVKAQNIL